MDDMNVFERRVADEMLRRAGPDPVVDDLAIFAAISTATQSPRRSFGSMFSATKFVVAGAIVALFGGFLLAGVLTTQPSDEQPPAVGASASASPEPEPVVTDVYDVGGYLDSLVESHGAIWAGGGDGPVQRIDPVTREVTEVVPRGSGVWYLVTTDDAVWASGEDGLLRIEPSTGAVTHSYPSVFSWRPPLEADGSLWVSGDGTLYEVDLESRDLVGEYDSPHVGGWIGSGDGELWLWGHDDVLARFDLDRREFDGVFPLPSSPWEGSTYEETHLVSEDAIWMAAEPSGQVLRFDISSREVTEALDLSADSGYPGAGTGTVDAVWIPSGDVVYRIDRQSRQITDEIEVDGSRVNPVPVVADGALWVATRDPGAVHRIDLESRQVTHAVNIGGEPFALASSDGDIWVAGGRGIVTRISTGATDAEEAPEPSPISEPPDLEDTTTPDLLPGVDLVTEEVGPGVYRVLSDGHRDLTSSVWGVAVSGAGDVWVDRRVDSATRVSRLGSEQEYQLGTDDVESIGTALSVDRDGSIRATPRLGGEPGGEMTFDGDAWIPAEERLALGGNGTADAVEGDGFQASPFTLGWGLQVARQSPDGVESATIGLLSTDLEFRLTDAGGAVLVAEASDGTIWVSLSTPGSSLFRLAKFDGSTFEPIETRGPSGPSRSGLDSSGQNVLTDIAEGPDGTLWVSSWQKHADVLYVWSWDGLSWTAYDPVETEAGVAWSEVWAGYQGLWGSSLRTGTWFEPDGSVWFDGLVHFDGGRFTSLDAPVESEDGTTVVTAISVAPDGMIWIVMVGGYPEGCESSPTCGTSVDGLYVITPEAVAAAVTVAVEPVEQAEPVDTTSTPDLLPGVDTVRTAAEAVATDDALWGHWSGRPFRIDTVTGEEVRIPTPSETRLLLPTDDAIWASGEEGLYRIDRASLSVTDSIDVASGPFIIVDRTLWLWSLEPTHSSLVEIDLETRAIRDEYEVEGSWVYGTDEGWWWAEYERSIGMVDDPVDGGSPWQLLVRPRTCCLRTRGR